MDVPNWIDNLPEDLRQVFLTTAAGVDVTVMESVVIGSIRDVDTAGEEAVINVDLDTVAMDTLGLAVATAFLFPSGDNKPNKVVEMGLVWKDDLELEKTLNGPLTKDLKLPI